MEKTARAIRGTRLHYRQKKTLERALNQCLDVLALTNCTVSIESTETGQRDFMVYRGGMKVGEYHIEPISDVEMAISSVGLPLGNDAEAGNTLEECKKEPHHELEKAKVEATEDCNDETIVSDVDNDDTFDFKRLPLNQQEGTQCTKAFGKRSGQLKSQSKIKVPQAPKLIGKAKQTSSVTPGLNVKIQTKLSIAGKNGQLTFKKTPSGRKSSGTFKTPGNSLGRRSMNPKVITPRPSNKMLVGRKLRGSNRHHGLSIGRPMTGILI